jgi:two-component sensor histidine kinase
MHFCGRLDVLAHYMLPHSGRWDATVDLENVIRDELRNFQFGDAPGIAIAGPDTALSLEQAQSFALMIHELTTNALKFGALSVQNAQLSVTWELHDGCLKLVWAETGVPIVVSAPVHRGFGLEFIEEALPYQIGAITQFERRPGGVVCTIELQLAQPQADEPSVNHEEP